MRKFHVVLLVISSLTIGFCGGAIVTTEYIFNQEQEINTEIEQMKEEMDRSALPKQDDTSIGL